MRATGTSPLALPPHLGGRVRFSHLRTLGYRSPAHLLASDDVDTAATERGTAVHSLVLGGARVIEYPKRRAGKEWEAFALQNADAIILTANEYEKAVAMADAVRAHPLAMRALDGNREQTLEWDNCGIPCRGTPDVWTPARVTDLKTARSSHPDEFTRQALRMCYHGQHAWYADGLRTLRLADPQEHLIVAVESEPPFVVTVFRLSQRALEDGERKTRLWFERLKVCLEARVWPAYTEAVVEVDVPEEMPEFAFADEPVDVDGAGAAAGE